MTNPPYLLKLTKLVKLEGGGRLANAPYPLKLVKLVKLGKLSPGNSRGCAFASRYLPEFLRAPPKGAGEREQLPPFHASGAYASCR